MEVAGKTGTAQTGVEGEAPHAWFIAFAAGTRRGDAVAVIVEHGGSFGNEATGGAVAAPIAKQVLQNLLATNPEKFPGGHRPSRSSSRTAKSSLGDVIGQGGMAQDVLGHDRLLTAGWR